MSMVEAKSQEITESLKAVGVGIDPVIIVTIITEVIKLFIGCAVPAKTAAARLKNPRFLDRVIIRERVEAHVPDPSQYDHVEAACLDAGRNVSVPAVNLMYTEARKA